MESRYILFSFTATPVELRADWRDFSAMVQLDSRAETWLALVLPYIFSNNERDFNKYLLNIYKGI